jgi:ribonuclease HI
MTDSELELLRRIYRHLKRTRFQPSDPSKQRELDALFKKMAAYLMRPDQGSANAERPALVLNTDGASRGNPGPSAGGGVLADADGFPLDSFAVHFGVRTNNEAEYLALIEGLKRAVRFNPKSLEVRSDSLLLIKQMKGEFRVKKRELVLLHLSARKLLRGISAHFLHVPRRENEEADRLANLALDAAGDGAALE